ncbi:hypothetical protein R1sor_020093 [Riccia sorocarpa]|uniref:serine O-acetyltransferase n=1 Tax=Riccia sorocarpa TaxID=122646 RepID=A0ABD3IIL5_9MARC
MACLAHCVVGLEVSRTGHSCSGSGRSHFNRMCNPQTSTTKRVLRRARTGGRISCGISDPCSGDGPEPHSNGKFGPKKFNPDSFDCLEGSADSVAHEDKTGPEDSVDSLEGGKMRVETTPWKNVFPAYMQSKEDEGISTESGDGVVGSFSGVTEKVAAKAAAAAAASTKALESQYRTPNGSSQSAVPPPRENLDGLISGDPIWAAIRAEARLEAEREPLLSSFLYASILAHSCFERSLGFVLANRLKNATLLATQLMDIFDDVFQNDAYVVQAIRLDVQAVKDRDPSCKYYSSALLYLKGYHAIQAYRVAHALWNRGQKVLALALQARISEVFAVDIHPAARIGKSILLDHGTGVVIGETAVVEDRVSMLQGVTLGGTGKATGDRHPKIRGGVLIGAGATILGNIVVGKGAMIAAGSLVLKNVPAHSMVAGTPAKVVGYLDEPSPSLTMKHDVTKDFCRELEEAVRRQTQLENRLSGGAGI